MYKSTTFYASDNELIKWTGENGKLYCAHIQKEYDNSTSPREGDEGILTTMACFHSRYCLGDDLGGDYYASDYLLKLVKDTFTDDDLVVAVKAGKYSCLRIANNDKNPSHYDILGEEGDGVLCENIEEKYLGSELADLIKECFSVKECLTLLSDHFECLPLWMYDHSGITMSCGTRNPYNDRRDSSQVGWIFAKKETIIKAGVAVEENWREVAKKIMAKDVKTYDYFLTDEVYGYTLYEADQPQDAANEPEWKVLDSVWGFYGSDVIESGIADKAGFVDALKNNNFKTGKAEKVYRVSYEFNFAD